jgi:Sec-independent protein translocase protein TatA
MARERVLLHDSMILGLLVPSEIALAIVIGALLIYGKRLPEIGRSVGRSIVEFKKGLAGVDDDAEKNAPSKPEKDPGKPS